MLLCSAANGYILFSSHATASVFKYMRREILFSLILMLPVFIPGFLSTLYSVLLYMTVLIFTFANAIHFHLYGMPIGPYVFTVIKETYFTESIEFIEQYFDITITLIILCGIALTFPFLRIVLKNTKRNWKLSTFIVLFFITLFSIAAVRNGLNTVLQWNYYSFFVYSSRNR